MRLVTRRRPSGMNSTLNAPGAGRFATSASPVGPRSQIFTTESSVVGGHHPGSIGREGHSPRSQLRRLLSRQRPQLLDTRRPGSPTPSRCRLTLPSPGERSQGSRRRRGRVRSDRAACDEAFPSPHPTHAWRPGCPRRHIGHQDSRTLPDNSGAATTVGCPEEERFFTGPHIEHCIITSQLLHSRTDRHGDGPPVRTEGGVVRTSNAHGRDHPIRGYVQNPDDPLVEPGSGDERIVGAEGRTPYTAIARQGRDEPPSRGVPHLQLAVISGGGEPRAVRAERDVVDVPVVPVEREDALSGLAVPDVDYARILGPLGHEDSRGAPGEGSSDPGHLELES